MSTERPVTAQSARSWFGQPAGLSTLFFTEMWERFSYYGMRALLMLFLTQAVARGGFGLDDKTAAAIYGLYTAGVYVFSVLGGWVADRLVGSQRAVLWGGISITLGHLLLGVSGDLSRVFYLGLVLIVLGTGFLKPNANALVAQIYPEGGQRRDVGFSIFYMSINIGAMVAPLITGWLHASYGWHAGFAAASVFMFLGLVQFVLTRHRLQGAGSSPAHLSGGAVDPRTGRFLSLGLAFAIGLIALIWCGAVPFSPVAVQNWSAAAIVTVAALYFAYLIFFAGLTSLERKRAVLLLALVVASALFWSGFEQAGSSFNLFADRYTDRHTGWAKLPELPTEFLQSVNSLFIVIFAPLFAALWVQLGARGLNPRAPFKFALGLLGMALGFLILAMAARIVAHGALAGMGWLTMVYLLHSFGELCLSPVGLSTVTQLVPTRFVSQSLGIWFISLGMGNLLAGRMAGQFDSSNLAAYPAQFMSVFWFGTISAVVLLAVGWLLQRWIGDKE